MSSTLDQAINTTSHRLISLELALKAHAEAIDRLSDAVPTYGEYAGAAAQARRLMPLLHRTYYAHDRLLMEWRAERRRT